MISLAPTNADVEAMIPMVEALVSTRYRLGGVGIERDDLIQAGMEGVCKAAKRWDSSKSTFRSYAYMRAHGEIRDYLRSRRPGTKTYPQDDPISLSLPKSADAGEDRTLGDGLACEDRYDGLVWADLERSIGPRATRLLRLYTGGLRLHEIAEGEGVSEACISLRITKVRPAVRAWAGRVAA